MTIVEKYRQLVAQRAYGRRIATEGLPAALEPYRGAIPAQRHPARRA